MVAHACCKRAFALSSTRSWRAASPGASSASSSASRASAPLALLPAMPPRLPPLVAPPLRRPGPRPRPRARGSGSWPRPPKRPCALRSPARGPLGRSTGPRIGRISCRILRSRRRTSCRNPRRSSAPWRPWRPASRLAGGSWCRCGSRSRRRGLSARSASAPWRPPRPSAGSSMPIPPRCGRSSRPPWTGAGTSSRRCASRWRPSAWTASACRS
mmetsp:Transcript_153657/g.492544  ORF Transcript_153657/g.492544 Transcript_153657/m.492544 type:complete len:214 (-) Transcript_153657:503-1144(-)